MRPIASMNVATAAIDNPAICAGVMVFGPVSAAVAAAAVAVGEGKDVSEGVKGIESGVTGSVGVG